MIRLVFLLFIPLIHTLPTNSYYLINIDQNFSSNETYCSNILINDQTYRLPQQCHHHLLCNPSYCDDKAFRCIKIRETLCCLYQYLQTNCQEENSIRIKDLFRSIYFHMSIEHGYCEINLERIEKIDQAYCIANIEESTLATTTMIGISSSSRSSFKHFHRRPFSLRPNSYRHRLAARQNYTSMTNLDYLRRFTIIEETISSKSCKIYLEFFLIICLIFLHLI